MAGTSPVQWIVIVKTDDAELCKMLKMPPSAKLSEVMLTWLDKCRLIGGWSFFSIDEELEYEDHSITLQMIGEMAPNAGIVTLKAKWSDRLKLRRINRLFVYLNGQCHDILVTSDQVLRDALFQVTRQPLTFEYNGLPINLNMTVRQAGLTNEAVIYESLHKIYVRSSDGVLRQIEMNADSLVVQLMERVKSYETDENFSMTHRGRHLDLGEPVNGLQHVVEVSCTEFMVQFKDKCVSFETKNEPVTFPDFLSQLSVKMQLDPQQLQDMKFYCVGCQRCISKSEDDIQLMPVRCCKEKSLSLIAKTPQESNSETEMEARIECLHRIYRDLLKISTTEASREEFRKLKERVEAEEWLTIDEFMKWSKELRKVVEGLKENIETLEEDKRRLTKQLRTNRSSLKVHRSKIGILERSSKNLQVEVKTNKEILVARTDDLELQRAMHDDLCKNVKKLQEKVEALMNNLLDVNKCLHTDLGAKLFVKYDDKLFSPIVSRPELKFRGQYPRSFHFIKCDVGGLRPGWATYKAVKNVLKRLFTGPDIRMISQYRGSFNGRDMAEVSSLTTDEMVMELEQMPFCSLDGRETVGEEANPEWQNIKDGGRIFIPGGRRSTILWFTS